jgi:hypothetical protein
MGFSGFFKRLFSSQTGRDRSAYGLAVKCSRCGEVIHTRVDLNHDLSVDYGDSVEPVGYYCRKVLIGDRLCFQSIEVLLKFDANYNLTDRQISGGEFEN